MTVSKSFVAYTLRREAYRIAELRRVIRRRRVRAGRCNLFWAIDFTGKYDTNGKMNPILGIVDHSTRLLLCLNRPVNGTSWVLLGYLFLAIGRYGKPKAVRTDNAPVFTSRLFYLMLRLVGIVHQRTELGHPWEKGRIERLFRTLKEKLDRIEVSAPKELTRLLSEFCFWHNEIRPHQNLDGLTPYEVWYHIDPYEKAPWRTSWYSGWGGLLIGFVYRR